MATCDDRQLTQAQRQEGFLQQQRLGVIQAIRPFTGLPTLPNLVDYINRELFPVLRQTRGKVNDVYRQVTDNAPSGNPLVYYFSTTTTNADPTAGRVRFDNATQNLATTIRISETNGQLRDATPWLDVMAGGSTAPLGVITITDAINPDRFVRFDVNTMTDQGAYWDLAVAPIESSHDSPFVDDNPIAIGFIPGVASTGTTVPVSSVTPMGAYTVLGNPTGSTAAPVEIPLNTLSVLGRAGLAGTGNVESVDVPDTSQFTGESVFLRSSFTRTTLQFRSFTFVDLPMIADNSFIGNIIGTTSRPYRANFSDLDSNSIVYVNGTKEFVREALTGDITAAQNVNITAFRAFTGLSVLGQAANVTAVPTEISATAASAAVLRESGGTIGWGTIATAALADDVVTDAKLRNSVALSVIGRAANSAGDPADIAATAGSNAVFRESGNTVGWGTVANAGLGTMVARSIKGRADGAGTGSPQDLTGLQAGAILRFDNAASDTTSTGAITALAVGSGVNNFTFNGNTVVLHGIAAPTERGQILWIRHIGAGTCTLVQESSSASANDRLALGDGFASNTNAIILGSAGGTFNRSVMLMYTGSRWQRLDEAIAELAVVTQNIANNAVTDTKIRDSAALSVIGRSANSSGDPADIAAANDGEVLRRSGTTLGFGTVATAGITNNAVTNAKLAQMAERRIKGRADSAGTGDPQDLTGAQVGAIMRWGNQVSDTTTTGSVATLTVAASTNLYVFNSVSPVLHGMSIPTELGQVVAIQHIGSGSTSIVHESSTAGAAAQRFRLGPFASNTTALVIRQGQTALFTYDNRWLWVGGAGALVDGDKGDITVSSQGATFTIDNNVVSDAKFRQSAGVSVVGRSANSTGNVADITASANNRVFVRRSDALSFEQIVDGDIAAGTISLGKIIGLNPNVVLGNNTGSATNPVEISVGTNTVLGRVAGNIVAAQLVTAQITDANVTLAKMADLAQSRIIGRAEGAGTGVPTALTPTQVVSIIDGENATWTGAHSFTGSSHTINTAGAFTVDTAFADIASTGDIVLSAGDIVTLAAANVVEVTSPFVVANSLTVSGPGPVGVDVSGNIDIESDLNITIASGATLTLAASSTVTVGSPLEVNNTALFTSGITQVGTFSSSSVGLDNLAIGNVSVVRLTASNFLFSGAVPQRDGQTIMIVNAHSTDPGAIMLESASSSAANRFAGVGTSRSIRPGEMALAWYDGTSDRWRLLCRDDADL